MKKLMNQPEHFVKETMEGIIAAYGDKVRLLNGDYRILLSNYETRPGKVGIVTAGGSGHLPVFLGYVGQGLLDGCTVGNVFASPSAAKMADMIRACDRGNGVLVLFGNYGGDRMNFELACEARHALEKIRTMGVALSSCTVPQVGEPTFSIAEDEIEIGMGIHGEPGLEVRKMMTADQVAETLVQKITEDMPLESGDEVSVMVNGLGATPLEEQLIVYRRVHALLTQMGVRIFMPHIGEYATSMEMAGLSLTIMKLDEVLKGLLSQTARSPFYTNYNK